VRTLLLIGAVSAAALAAGGAQAASKLEIKDAVVRVLVIPENRPDVQVEVTRRNDKLPMDMQVDGDTVKINGNLERNAIQGCWGNSPKSVRVRDRGAIRYEDLPQITVRMPMDVELRGGGAVFGEIRNASSVELRNAGCGDWKIADVRGLLKIRQAGSGLTQAGRSGSLEIRVAGSGDVSTGSVVGDVDINIAGSGDARVASLGGALAAKIAGSGDIRVDGGRASTMTANIAGSGGIRFAGVTGALKANIAGSGDISALRVEGPIDRRVVGSGDIRVGQ
jgi:hypothetical protein